MKQHKRLIIGGALLLILICGALVLAFGIEDWTPLFPAEPNLNKLKSNGKLYVDANNVSEGYFMAACKSSKRMKMRVSKDGTTLTYDLDNTGVFVVFPLQLGSGSYQVTLYENVSGKSYSQAGSVQLWVSLSREDICFLYPNLYVNYDEETEAIAKAAEICEGMNARKAYEAICKYMKVNFVYDYLKATTVSGKTGVMPDIEEAWSKKMGICQDLSAIMCCMLRTQGIPAKMMIGMADKTAHAWVIAIVDGEEEFFDPTAAISGIGKVKKYTEERFY